MPNVTMCYVTNCKEPFSTRNLTKFARKLPPFDLQPPKSSKTFGHSPVKKYGFFPIYTWLLFNYKCLFSNYTCLVLYNLRKYILVYTYSNHATELFKTNKHSLLFDTTPTLLVYLATELQNTLNCSFLTVATLSSVLITDRYVKKRA